MKMMKVAVILAAALAAGPVGAAGASEIEAIVATGSGQVQGVAGDALLTFKGIPYAAPPHSQSHPGPRSRTPALSARAAFPVSSMHPSRNPTRARTA